MAKKKKEPDAPPADSPPQPEKPKVIQIVSVYRGRRNVVIHWLQGDAKHSLDERDAPLPAFYAAFDALPEVVATICHLGAKYAAKGLRVVKMDCGEKGGAPTVALHARKDIDDAMKEFAFKTPERLLAHPSAEGKYTAPLTPSDVALVEEMIEQAKQYIWGHRAQGIIEFHEEGAQEGDSADDELQLDSAAQ